MGRIRKSSLFIGLISLSLTMTIELVKASPEPPVPNYMANYYDANPMPVQDDAESGYSPGVGGYDDDHHSHSPHSGGYSSSPYDEDDYEGPSYSKGGPPSHSHSSYHSGKGPYRGHSHGTHSHSPSYGSYRPSKGGYSKSNKSPYSSPYSKGKGPRPGKYGGGGYGGGGGYPYGKGPPPHVSHHYHEEHTVEEGPVKYYGKGSSGGHSGGGYKMIEETSGDYSPYSGYRPQGWFNTMKGSYDDFGYNDHKPKGSNKGYAYPEHGTKDGYEGPEHSSGYSYGESSDDEPEPKGYSAPSYSSGKGSRRPETKGYSSGPYSSPSTKYGPPKSTYGGPKGSYGSPKDTYSYNSSPPKPSYGPPKKYTSSTGLLSAYGSSDATGSGSKGGSAGGYGGGYGKHTGNKDVDDYSNYYRTRSGGFARKPPVIRAMTGYKFKYSTIGFPNTHFHDKAKNEFENGPSEDYGPRNWENDGWTVAH